jgi:hypothetical protein
MTLLPIIKAWNPTSLLWFAASLLLLNGCATNTFVKYEHGDVLASHQNLKTSPEPTKYEASFAAVPDSKDASELKLVRLQQTKEQWEDVYSKVAVYDKHCRGWRSGKDHIFASNGNVAPYCEFSTADFVLSHIVLFGFIYDLTIPFQSYEEQSVVEKEIEEDTFTEADSQIVTKSVPLGADLVTLTINGASVSSKFIDGTVKFDFKALKVNPDRSPAGIKVSVDADGTQLDTTAEFSHFLEREADRKIADAKAVEDEKNRPENKFKMKYCNDRDLIDKIYQPNSGALESSCIYIIEGLLKGPLKVIQSTDGGVLVGLAVSYPGMSDKIFFIRTNKPFVDGDRIGRMLVRSTGPLRYKAVFGDERTVHSFQYLGEIEQDQD